MLGLICAAEHYDLPDLLQACFHHAKQFIRTEIVSKIVCSVPPMPLLHVAGMSDAVFPGDILLAV